MRCLRKLTDEQLKATVFLSKENLDTLDEELRNNYNMEIKDLGQSSDKKKNSYKVRVLPPPRSIKMKRIWHEYSLIEKEYSEPIDFKVSEIDDAKYESKMYEKSFHADTYCFDSKPEKECFLQYISSKKVKEIYFTGMFTANQGDLFVQYYDPESKRIRQYYPDFLAKMNDGSYQLIEVKGDNMIDDEVVKAKAEAAEEMSVASGMKYVMYAGSVLMKQNVLEHPPVTYSEEPSPLLMVAEDPVPYGK